MQLLLQPIKAAAALLLLMARASGSLSTDIYFSWTDGGQIAQGGKSIAASASGVFAEFKTTPLPSHETLLTLMRDNSADLVMDIVCDGGQHSSGPRSYLSTTSNNVHLIWRPGKPTYRLVLGDGSEFVSVVRSTCQAPRLYVKMQGDISGFSASEPPAMEQKLRTHNVFAFTDLGAIGHDGRLVEPHGGFVSLFKTPPFEPVDQSLTITMRMSGGDSKKLRLGIQCNGEKVQWLSMEDCCHQKSLNNSRVCVPTDDCPTDHVKLRLIRNDTPEQTWIFGLTFSKEGWYYSIYEGKGLCEAAVLWAEIHPGGPKLTGFQVQSDEEVWIEKHIKAGATMAREDEEGGRCGTGKALCGDSDKCYGVCDGCGPPRYCMCYPNGYVGTDGVFYPGARCLKQGGSGTNVMEPARKQPEGLGGSTVRNLEVRFK